MSAHISSMVLLLAFGVADEADRYPRAGLLLEPAELAKPEIARKFRILDARGKDSYNQGHIPRALWVDHALWMRGFGEGQDADAWAKRIGALGISLDTPVVLYDNNQFKDAARLWWILHYWGVRDVRLLNGGFKAWNAKGYPLSKATTKVDAVEVKVQPQASRLATKEQVLDSVKSSKGQIIDARSLDEYQGKEETAKRNGSIPGARHFEWSDAIDPKTGRFKRAPELAKLLKEHGIDPSQPCTTYCQSGGRAAVMAFTLELMGSKEVRNYYKSWAEWGNAEDTPIDKKK